MNQTPIKNWASEVCNTVCNDFLIQLNGILFTNGKSSFYISVVSWKGYAYKAYPVGAKYFLLRCHHFNRWLGWQKEAISRMIWNDWHTNTGRNTLRLRCQFRRKVNPPLGIPHHTTLGMPKGGFTLRLKMGLKLFFVRLSNFSESGSLRLLVLCIPFPVNFRAWILVWNAIAIRRWLIHTSILECKLYKTITFSVYRFIRPAVVPCVYV